MEFIFLSVDFLDIRCIIIDEELNLLISNHIKKVTLIKNILSVEW